MAEIVMTREFDAPRELVFRAWTDPAHLARWWGPHTFTNPECQIDLRAGGRFRIVMRGPDGSDYPVTGTYREIDPPRRLVFTDDISSMPDWWVSTVNERRGRPADDRHLPMLVAVTLEDLGGRTRLTMVTTFENDADRDAILSLGSNEGWSQSFERLESAVMSDASPSELIVVRMFDAPRERVFDAWVDPVHIVEWWGPAGFTTTTHARDVRVGGTWRYTMHGPDGTDYPNVVTYHEIRRPELLRYDHGDDRDPARFRVTVTFIAVESRTRLMLRSEFPSRADRDRVIREYGAELGAHQTLDRLAALLAGRQTQ